MVRMVFLRLYCRIRKSDRIWRSAYWNYWYNRGKVFNMGTVDFENDNPWFHTGNSGLWRMIEYDESE